jgi:hypothetical protein
VATFEEPFAAVLLQVRIGYRDGAGVAVVALLGSAGWS